MTPVFFSESVRDNLTLHDPAITDQQIWTVLDQVKPPGATGANESRLDTVVAASHVPFSSGEQQRLELARALLHQAVCWFSMSRQATWTPKMNG